MSSVSLFGYTYVSVCPSDIPRIGSVIVRLVPFIAAKVHTIIDFPFAFRTVVREPQAAIGIYILSSTGMRGASADYRRESRIYVPIEFVARSLSDTSI